MAGVPETAGEVEGFFFEVEKEVQGAFYTAQPGWIAIGDIARCFRGILPFLADAARHHRYPKVRLGRSYNHPCCAH